VAFRELLDGFDDRGVLGYIERLDDVVGGGPDALPAEWSCESPFTIGGSRERVRNTRSMAPGFAQTLENQLRNEHGAEPAVGQLERIESSTMSDGLSVTLCVMDASACVI
tara:strand:+ start:1701 stop:2030 length:330 start_codon:yes stop_codon:yes gene_type:complete